MSFFTCFWDFPQKEHLSRSPPSPNFGTEVPLSLGLLHRRSFIICVAQSRRFSPGYSGTLLGHRTAGDDVVDDTVALRFSRIHETVPVDVLLHLLDGLVRVFRDDLGHPTAQRQYLFGMYLDVGWCSLEAGRTLVDHDLRVGQREALAVSASTQQDRPHRHRHPHTDR